MTIKKSFKNLKIKFPNFKKIFITIALSIVTIGLSTGIYFVFFNKNIKNENLIPDIIEPNIENDKVFPEINSRDFYHLIEFKDGLPFIGDKMIAAIIKDIITRFGSAEGDLHFYVIKNSLIEKIIYFKWINNEKEIKKSYIISLNGL